MAQGHEGGKLMSKTLQVRAKISLDDKDSYSPNSNEKNIILKAFEVFISEMSTESESIPLTDHNKTEIQKLYKKIKELYKKIKEMYRD
jgi:coenzyme F420-reducing hydrogenase delta subunit